MKVVYSNEVTNVSKADHHGVVSWGSMSFEGQCLGHLPIKVKDQGQRSRSSKDQGQSFWIAQSGSQIHMTK